MLSRFVTYAASLGLELYPAQEEAILELLSGKHLILNTPTGSGKSLVAAALHFKAMAEGKVSFYTCPIKALVNEKFFALCTDFGAENVGMLTGDASINRDAKIICCTAEILSNLTLRGAAGHVGYVVMDEFHYYADRERGMAWQVPLLAMPDAVFLLMSATLGEVQGIAGSLEEVTGREVAIVRSATRPVPLDFEYRETPLHETIEALVSQGRAPIYLVNFTQRSAAEEAQNLMSVNFASKEEKEAIRRELEGTRFDTPYGKELQRFLRHGVGLHHAGLLPKYRRLVERLAQGGRLRVVSGTDTLGVGVNVPIRTVLFTQLCKFDGEKVRVLSVRDFQQLAGRAGRKGFDTQGSVVIQAPEHVIENLKQAQKEAQGQARQARKKKVPKKQPPQKGYAHWDKAAMEKLRDGSPEPLESRFEVTHGILLSLLQSASNGYRRLVELISRSHLSDWNRRRQLRVAAQAFRVLRGAGVVQVEGGRPAQVKVEEGLQRDFSLHQTLSLYLLDTLETLDPAGESYALDLLTLVESILENPDPVLYAQLNRLKGEKVAELKAQGMEYEERMAELEKLEWPKPNRELIYDTFNAFADRHPWVGQENIRPKSVARELLEGFVSFNDYVRDLGLERSEGVLLRYLSEVYRTLMQNVPERYRTEEVEDVIAFLRTLIRSVDSSLLDEWEGLQNPEAVAMRIPAEAVAAPAWARQLTPKEIAARVRAELHRLVKALAEKRYEEALELIDSGEGDWTPERLETEMAPYWAEHAAVDLTPRARRPSLTQIREIAPRQWEARQTLLDPQGDGDWMLEVVFDTRKSQGTELPRPVLRRLGT